MVAILFRTPFLAFVFANFNVFLDINIHLLHFLRAEQFNLFVIKLFFTELFRTGDSVNFADIHLDFEMVTDTINAETMFAFKTEKVAFGIVLIANFTHLTIIRVTRLSLFSINIFNSIQKWLS